MRNFAGAEMCPSYAVGLAEGTVHIHVFTWRHRAPTQPASRLQDNRGMGVTPHYVSRS